MTIVMQKNFKLDDVRLLLKEGKPFNEIMRDILKKGKEIVDQIGHKDYDSPEQLFQEIAEGKSPLNEIDGEIDADLLDTGINVFAVKKCALGDLMQEMLDSKEGRDNTVRSVMDGFHIRENEDHAFIDIGCYIMQSIRQMVISSLKVKGKYDLNYIHLGCKRGGKTTFCEGDIAAIGIDKSKIEEILKDHECVFTISYKEAE